MIYLKPLGGLCNRLRAVDSMISICRIFKKDLTVLWVKDSSLNCSFLDLYKTPVVPELKLVFIDCPTNFPEDFPILFKGNEKYNSVSKTSIRQLKNILKKRFIDRSQKDIRNRIFNIDSTNRLVDDELEVIYSSSNYIETKSTREMDALFISKIEPRVTRLISSNTKDIYIKSCYRLYGLENNYLSFIPTQDLNRKIEKKTKAFVNTFGIHIRRSDHKTSKGFSTLEKFIKLIDLILTNNSDASFFLSTDDSETKSALISKYGSKIITNEISSYDRNSPEAVKDAVLDLHCLAATKKVYGSHHSSFSQTAADIGGIEEITVK